MPVNSRIGEITSSLHSNLFARGIEIYSKNGTTGGLAQASVLQSNRFANPTFTPQTCTANGTANLTVADGSKLCVGMPIAFTTIVGGLSATTVYFVKTVVGNVITISGTTTYGAAVVISAGAPVLVCMGFPALSIYTESGTSSAAMAKVEVLDLEGGGTTRLFMQGCNASEMFAPSSLSTGADSFVEVCMRVSTFVSFHVNQSTRFDMDGSTTSATIYGMTGPINGVIGGKAVCVGHYYDGANTVGLLNLAKTNGASNLPSLISRSPGFSDFTYPGVPMGQRQGYSTATTATINLAHPCAGFGVYTGTGAAVWTWDQYLNNYAPGMRQTFKNKGTGTLTITLAASINTFDGMTGGVSLGKSMILSAPTTTTPGGCLTMVCCEVSSGGYQWQIESMLNATLV